MNMVKTGVVLLLAVILAIALYNMATLAHATTPPSATSALNVSIGVPPARSFSHRLVGPPTVTAAFIDRVLQDAGSPAVGIGTVMYQQGVRYGIDPIYALAFFHHESSFGRAGVARITHSIGNIRCSLGYTCDPSGGYRAYPSYAVALNDWYALLATVYIAHGLTTVETIIPVYAPAADNNNESAYIASVNSDVTRWRKGEL